MNNIFQLGGFSFLSHKYCANVYVKEQFHLVFFTAAQAFLVWKTQTTLLKGITFEHMVWVLQPSFPLLFFQ